MIILVQDIIREKRNLYNVVNKKIITDSFTLRSSSVRSKPVDRFHLNDASYVFLQSVFGFIHHQTYLSYSNSSHSKLHVRLVYIYFRKTVSKAGQEDIKVTYLDLLLANRSFGESSKKFVCFDTLRAESRASKGQKTQKNGKKM